MHSVLLGAVVAHYDEEGFFLDRIGKTANFGLEFLEEVG
jgi:hypothetical protein